jgi:hypothetical protein
VDRALRDSLQTASARLHHKHELLLSGGDEAAIMLPASLAIQFLEDFRAVFDAQWASHLPNQQRPFFSAALVIAHGHFPIYSFFNIAKTLLRSAKLRKGSDSLDWELISSSNAEQDPIGMRHGLASFGLFRTAKPYSWPEWQNLLSGIREIKASQAPSTKIHSLYRMSYLHRDEAEYEYFRLLLSLPHKLSDTLMKLVGSGTLFQPRYDGTRGTRAADVVELWEFIHQ